MKVWKTNLIVHFTRFFLIPVFFLLLHGCGFREIKIDPQERNYLKEEPKIVAVHYNVWPSLTVESIRLFGGPQIDSLAMEAPLLRVKERFLSTLETELGLTNIRFIEEAHFSRSIPAIGADLYPLKRTFGNGLVFDSEMVLWSLLNYKFDTNHYTIFLTVRARLIRLDNLQIMWQSLCHIDDQKRTWWEWGVYVAPKEGRRTLTELTANDYAVLKERRDKTADMCVDQLLAQFLGKEINAR